MSDFAIFDRPLDSDTPVGVLSGIDLRGYDHVIAEFKKRRAEKEEAQRRALAAARELCTSLSKMFETFPKIESAGISSEFNRLDAAETLLSDGIVPENAEELHNEFSGYLTRLAIVQKDVNKAIKVICPAVKTVDANLSATLRSRLGAFEHIVKRFVNHYRHMIERTKVIVQRSQAGPDGPVARAWRLYVEALNTAGVRNVGNLEADVRPHVPLYKLPVSVDASIFNDRRRLRELERIADEYVGERDPTSIGMIVFHFEPTNGAT